MRIEEHSIVWANVPYRERSGSKTRPALVLSFDGEAISYYPITTKFENKSEIIKRQYFEIKQWAEAHLPKASWVDVGNLKVMDRSAVFSLIGELTPSDVNRLKVFLSELGE